MTDITINNAGVELAASIFGTLDAPPILFLHGMSLSRDTWAEAAERLAHSHCVWTLDFRGHGHSDRASSYEIADYVSDVEAALDAIGRPALVVGHSLGGCVAGVLAQTKRVHLRGVLLEDPPWYLGEPTEWARSAFPRLFGIVSGLQANWQRDGAPLSTYLDFVTNAPSPMRRRRWAAFPPIISARAICSATPRRCSGRTTPAGAMSRRA